MIEVIEAMQIGAAASVLVVAVLAWAHSSPLKGRPEPGPEQNMKGRR
jgi:hypothetical protein